jgi:hypothetical protein
MKMKFGALVIAGSGKIGGHVASKNKGGAYLRTKVTPSNPQTVAQSNARNILATLSTQWSGLSDSQRQSFNDAVADFSTTDIFGDLRNPSGINLYVKLNANLINTGQAQLTSAPSKIGIPYSEISSVAGDVSGNALTVAFADDALDGQQVLIRATAPQTQGTSFVKNKLRVIGSFAVDVDSVDIYSAYVAKFGAPSANDNIVISVAVVVPTGQQGTPQTAKAVIVA